MPQLEDSIVLILSSDPKKSDFGTGFIIARDQNYSYLLTCAHVLEQINGKPPTTENKLKISGLDKPVEIEVQGASDGIDIALLKVAGLFDKPLFEQFMLGQEKADIKVTGYSLFDSKNGQRLQRELKGKLSNRTKLASNNQEYPFLDIAIQDDDFSKLEGGYSGSPLYDSSGRVLGVVSHKRTGEMGHAFCISNLLRLHPDVIKIIPALQYLEASYELEKLKLGLTQRKQEIPAIYPQLSEWVNSLTLEDLEKDKDAKRFISVLKSFIAGFMIGDDVIDFFNGLLEKQQQKTPVTNRPNYKLLGQRLKDGEICLCLGPDLPKLFDASLKSVQELPERIAALTGYANVNSSSLAEVCEYAELHTAWTRHSVVSELKELVTPPPLYQPNNTLYELLLKLEQPFLIISTGFDTLLEQRLSKSNQHFVSIVTNVTGDSENQRFILKYSDGNHRECSDEQLSALQLMEKGYSLIFHPRGYYDDKSKLDTLLLSERDYFFTARDLSKKHYPAYLHNKLKSKGLWFLGYQPDSWETRLLAKVLHHQRGNNNRDLPLVIQPNADSFAQLFWREMQCLHYNDLTDIEFVANVGEQL